MALKRKAKEPKPKKKAVGKSAPVQEAPPPQPTLPSILWDVTPTKRVYVTGEMQVWSGRCQWEGKLHAYNLIRTESNGAKAFSVEVHQKDFTKNGTFRAVELDDQKVGNYPRYWHHLDTALEKAENHLCTFLGVEAVVSNRDDLLAEAKKLGLDRPPAHVTAPMPSREEDAKPASQGEAGQRAPKAPRAPRAKNGNGSQDEKKGMDWFQANPEVRVTMTELVQKAGLRDTLYTFCKKQLLAGVLAKEGKHYFLPEPAKAKVKGGNK